MEKIRSFSSYMVTSNGEMVALASTQVMARGILHFLVQQHLQHEMLKLIATLELVEFMLTVSTFLILLVQEVSVLLFGGCKLQA